MIDSLLRWRPRRGSLLLFAIAGIAACSGQTCSCIAPIPGGFPQSQRHENGVQTRFTSSFLAYVSANAPAIVPNLLPGGETFNIPPVCSGTAEICCATPAPLCQMNVVPTAMTLTPSAPNTLHFSADLVVRSLENIPVSTSVGDCNVSFDTTASGATFLTATGDITLPVDSSTNLTQIVLANPSVDGIDDGDVNLDEAGSDDACAVANLGVVKGFIIDYIEDQVGGIVATAVQGELCQSCTDVSDCPSSATACTNMQCIGPDKMSCIQQLGIQGRADVGSALASFSPGLTAHIDLMEAAGGYATADTGLSLGILGGAQADPHNACVPVVAAPTAVDVAPSMSFTGDVVPGTTTPYHVGIGLHISHLTQLGYAFWDAGALCLSAGSDHITALSAKTLEIIMPSIADLIHGDDAPVLIKLRPQMPPTFVLGAGTFTDTGGTMKVDQPLVTMSAPQLALDMYLFVDDRFARIATITGDLTLPLGLETDATGAFVIVPGDLSKPLANVVVTNSDLLAETQADLEAAFPGLVALAIGPLVSSLPTLSLPSLAGLSLMPQVITSTDMDATGAYQFLAVYANVAPATTQVFKTSARLLGVTTPPTQVFDINHRDGRAPSVTVALDGVGAFEWSWRFDNGLWHPFQTAPQLTLTDPALWLQGKHTVALRGRLVGQPQSLDPAPVELPFIIDSEPPYGTFAVDAGHVVPTAHDRISADEALRYRIGDGAFVTAAQLGVVAGDPAQVTVQARDEAGNIGVLTYAGDGDAPKAAGCEVGRGSPVSLLALVVVLALLFRRRALLAFALLIGCHHGESKSSELSPTDVIGRNHDVQGFGAALHVAAYDQTFGDLGYATFEVADLTATPTWTIVDGVDETSPKDGMSPYRGGRTAAGPDVGFYSSLALTSKGKPHIAYYDATNHALKFASGPYPFKAHAVDTGMADGSIDVGTFPSLVLDSSDTPAIAYAATGMGDATSGFTSELRVARATTQTPESASDWTITTIDTVAIGCGGRCASSQACIIDAMVAGAANTNPAHSTCQAVDVAPCTPACTGTDVCIGGTCTSIVAPNLEGDLPEGTGLFTKLLIGPSGQPAIAYYDRTNAALRLAVVSASNTFVPQTLDGGTAGEDFGQQVSAAYDSSGTLHLAYVDDVLGQLDYRELTSAGMLSARVVIDDGLRPDGPHLVGASASVLVNATGTSVLYQDQTLSQLELASGTSASFTHAPFQTSEDGVGFSSHQVALANVPYYSTWRVDRTMTPLGYVELGTVQ